MKISIVVSLLLILVVLAGCAGEKQARLPVLQLEELVVIQPNDQCAAVFPQGKWQFVHSIEFTMKNGAGSTVIGVTNLTGTDIECALLTVEGLTLFEAIYHGKKSIEIRRAVPPFDQPGFAAGLLDDIRAIFLPPAGLKLQVRQLADGSSVCRYQESMRDAGDRVVDVLLDGDDCWEIKGYNADLIMDRSIIGRSCTKNGSSFIPEFLELQSYGRNGYTLKMTLLHAEIIQ